MRRCTVNPLRGEEYTHFHCLLHAEIDAAVGDGRDGEAHGFTCGVARGIPVAGVEFSRHIQRIVGAKDRSGATAVPGSGLYEPHDRVGRAIGGYGGRASGEAGFFRASKGGRARKTPIADGKILQRVPVAK